MRKYLAIVFLLFVCSACAQAPENANKTPSFIRTQKFTHTQKATQTLQPTETLPPTLAPLPTLDAEEAILFTERLLLNNADCEFPCWWGIVPGESEWAETEKFLESFVTSIQSTVDTDLGLSFLVVAPVSKNIRSKGWFDFVIKVESVDNQAIVQRIVVIDGYESQVSNILPNFGVPDQVWFWTNGPTIYNDGILILFYQERGMMFTYSGDVTLRKNNSGDEYFEVCSREIGVYGTQIQLWSPSESKDFFWFSEKLIADIPVTGDRPIRQLAQISDITVLDFYSGVLNSVESDSYCFTSDIKYWEYGE